jgi:uncharacterized protein (DUF427 family)
MDHPITVKPTRDHIEIFWRGHKILDTTAALELQEASYPVVIYAPRGDADMRFFERSTHETRCPYKGTANYFSLADGGANDANAVWTYETPKAGVEAIKDHLAFYPNKVEIKRTPA